MLSAGEKNDSEDNQRFQIKNEGTYREDIRYV